MPVPAALLLIVILLLANPLGVLWGNQIRYEPGILVDRDPVETVVPVKRSWEHNGRQVSAVREFEIDGRILAKKEYWFHDFSPMDVVMGWGPTTDQRVVDALNVVISDRTYSWSSVGMSTPLPPRMISEHLRFMHLVPADDSVKKRLENFAASDLVRFRGFLVTVEGESDLKAPSHIVWVESAETLGLPE